MALAVFQNDVSIICDDLKIFEEVNSRRGKINRRHAVFPLIEGRTDRLVVSINGEDVLIHDDSCLLRRHAYFELRSVRQGDAYGHHSLVVGIIEAAFSLLYLLSHRRRHGLQICSLESAYHCIKAGFSHKIEFRSVQKRRNGHIEILFLLKDGLEIVHALGRGCRYGYVFPEVAHSDTLECICLIIKSIRIFLQRIDFRSRRFRLRYRIRIRLRSRLGSRFFT